MTRQRPDDRNAITVHTCDMGRTTALHSSTQVVVLQGSGFSDWFIGWRETKRSRRGSDRRLAIVTAPEEIRLLADLLTDTVPGAASIDWLERPTLSFAFLSGDLVLREIGLLSDAVWVREADAGYLPLVSPSEVAAWLVASNIDLLTGR
jgi:hypothetical protein